MNICLFWHERIQKFFIRNSWQNGQALTYTIPFKGDTLKCDVTIFVTALKISFLYK